MVMVMMEVPFMLIGMRHLMVGGMVRLARFLERFGQRASRVFVHSYDSVSISVL